MSETLLANDPASREATGEIKDQSQPTKTEETKQETKVESKPEVKVETKVETKTDDKTEPSLLNDNDGKVEDKKDAIAAGAPEKYDLKPPADWVDKGYELDSKIIELAVPIFKDLNLDNAQAQKLVEFYAKTSEAANDAAMQAVVDQNKAWRDEVTKEFGSKLPGVKANVSKAIDNALGTELGASFRKAMDLTGAGNHPDFIRGFNKLAERWLEGKHVTGGGPTKEGQTRTGQVSPPSAAKALYPNLP